MIDDVERINISIYGMAKEYSPTVQDDRELKSKVKFLHKLIESYPLGAVSYIRKMRMSDKMEIILRYAVLVSELRDKALEVDGKVYIRGPVDRS